MSSVFRDRQPKVPRFMFHAYLAALAAAIAMAQSGIIARASGLAAAELTFYRLFIGALALALFVASRRQLQVLARMPSRHTVLNGVLLASFMLAFLQAIQTLSLANAILLVYLAPPLSAIIAHFWLKEPMDLTSMLLVAMSFFGFATLQEFKVDQLSGAQLTGFLYGVVSLATYSGFLLFNRHSRGGNELQRTFYQLLIGAACVVPFLTETPIPTLAQLPYAVAAGLIPGFLAIYFAINALNHLPTRVFGTLAYVEPVTVIVLGFVLFDEALSYVQLAGVVIILAAGALQAWHHQQQR